MDSSTPTGLNCLSSLDTLDELRARGIYLRATVVTSNSPADYAEPKSSAPLPYSHPCKSFLCCGRKVSHPFLSTHACSTNAYLHSWKSCVPTVQTCCYGTTIAYYHSYGTYQNSCWAWESSVDPSYVSSVDLFYVSSVDKLHAAPLLTERLLRVSEALKQLSEETPVSAQSKVSVPAVHSTEVSISSTKLSEVSVPAAASTEESEISVPAAASPELSKVSIPAAASTEESEISVPAVHFTEVSIPAVFSTEESKVSVPAAASTEESEVSVPAVFSTEESEVSVPAAPSIELSKISIPAATSTKESEVSIPVVPSTEESEVPVVTAPLENEAVSTKKPNEPLCTAHSCALKKLSGFQKRKMKKEKANASAEVSTATASKQQARKHIVGAEKRTSTKLIMGVVRRGSRTGRIPPPLRAGKKGTGNLASSDDKPLRASRASEAVMELSEEVTVEYQATEHLESETSHSSSLKVKHPTPTLVEQDIPVSTTVKSELSAPAILSTVESEVSVSATTVPLERNLPSLDALEKPVTTAMETTVSAPVPLEHGALISASIEQEIFPVTATIAPTTMKNEVSIPAVASTEECEISVLTAPLQNEASSIKLNEPLCADSHSCAPKKLSGFQKRKMKKEKANASAEVSTATASKQQDCKHIVGAEKRTSTKLIMGVVRRSSRTGKIPPPLRAGKKGTGI